MHYLHTMVRVKNLEESLDFYCNKLGLQEVHRYDNEKGRYTNVFLKAPSDTAALNERRDPPPPGQPILELTYNWPARAGGDSEDYTSGRNFGHLAYAVESIYDYCDRLMKLGVVINRPPRDGRMAFIRSSEGISIELLQIGGTLPIQEPWQSMKNVGTW